MRSRKLLVLIALVLGIPSDFAYAAPPIAITEIADTSTPMPGSAGNFTGFGIPSSDRDNLSFNYVGFDVSPSGYYDSNNIFFTAQGPNGLSGIYAADFPSPGVTEIVDLADTTKSDPSGGRLTSFSNTTSGESDVGFITNDSNGLQGVYVYSTVYGGPSLVATSNTSPVTGTTFGNFQSISFYGEGLHLVEEGEIGSDSGIYDFVPSPSPAFTFTLVANTSTIPPGASSPFTSFGPVSYKAQGQSGTTPGYVSTERAVLATVGSTPGIYYGKTGIHATSAPLVKLVDTNSPVPNGAGDFTNFGNPIATATYIEFIAGYSSSAGAHQGIFAYGPYLDGGDLPSLQEFLASGTVAPDSNGAHFASFLTLGNNEAGEGQNTGGSPDDETQDIPFLATLDNGIEGLYDTTGIGTSVKILDTSDIFNGKTVSSLELSPDSSGDVFTVFEVGFTDGSSGIYYFDTNVLPEPASICLIGLPLLLTRRRS